MSRFFSLRSLVALHLAASLVSVSTSSGQNPREDKGLPLAPTRTVEFSTDEATWLSLDVSPDGSTIVLELLGDLYTMPSGGGEASRITGGPDFDSQPRFSPDGERLAFLSDRDGAENLWIARADGSEARKLSSETKGQFASPAWMPDGEYVVTSRTNWGLRTFEIWMYHVEGGSGVRVTKAKVEDDTPTPQRHNALGVTISPEGRYLYYAHKRGGFGYNLSLPQWQIARLDLQTGEEDVLTQDFGSALRPLVSPDGRRLVYGTRYDTKTGLRIRDLETGDDRWLVYPVTRDDQESRFTRDLLPGYAFTPDGSSIILSIDGGIRRVDIETGAVAPIPFSAEVSQEIGPRLYSPYRVEEGPVRARIIQDAGQSPDGHRIAFSALTQLFVMDLADGEPRRLTGEDMPAFQPAWSSDGDWLTYVTWTSDGGHLWKIRADGSAPPERLSEVPAFYADPVWSPDGSLIVALRGSAHMRSRAASEWFGPAIPLDLISMPAGGGPASVILPARGLGKPHFGTDGGRIYVYDQGFEPDGGRGLISMRLDGTDRRTHVKVTGTGIYSHEKPVSAIDARMSPDGRWILAHVQNQLYLAAVPPVGGEAPTIDISKPAVPVGKLTDVGADYFAWANGGETITWAVGSTFFRRPLASVSFDTTDVQSDADRQVESFAVRVEVPRAGHERSVVLRGARAITMRGDEVIDDADIVVTGNRIQAVGPRGAVAVPEGAEIIDVGGMNALPGFVDTHAHWFEIRKGVLDVQNWSFLANLAYGVTTGLDVQTMTNDMFAYQDLVDAGRLLGPRAYSTGPGIFSNNEFTSVDQAKGVLRKYRDHYRTRNLKSYLVGNRKQQQYVAMAAHELGMMPTTEGALDLKLDLTHAIDGFSGNEHALPIVPLYRDVVELFAGSGIAYTPTLLVQYGGPWAENYFYQTTEVHDDPKLNRFVPHHLIDARARRRPWFREDEYVFEETARQAAKIARAGGRVGVGSHGQLQGLGYHWELWALASGMTPAEALRAATLHGAEIIGLGEDLGSLEPDKLADIVLLGENPLEDIRHSTSIRYVMKDGRLFDAETLTEVWPERRELEPQWWWDDAP